MGSRGKSSRQAYKQRIKTNEGTERQEEKRPLKDGSSPEQPEKVLKVGSSSSNDREGSSTMSSAHL